MIEGSSRAAAVRDALLFAAAGVVPAVLAVTLGLRAVRSEEAAIRREAAAETEAAASRAVAATRAALDEGAERLAVLRADAIPEGVDARRRLAASIAPAWAQPLVLDGRLEPVPIEPPARVGDAAPGAPQRSSSACRAAARDVARGASDVASLDGCAEARTELGRWLVPLALLARVAEQDDPAAAAMLVAWLEERAGRMHRAERAATREEIRASRLPPGAAARALAALERGDAGAALAAARSDAARAALAGGADGSGLIRWSGDGSAGFVRPADGGAIGFVIDGAALARALPVVVPDASAALRVVTDTPPPSSSPRGVAWLAPGLGVEATLPGGDDLAARTRRARWALWAIAGGAGSAALIFALVLFARLRAARRTSELRTSFAAAVSHELRTPIASIRMLAELLEDDRAGADEERRETASAIAREARRLGETVSRLLAWSRMREGRAAITRQPADLAEVVGDAVDVFEERHPGVAVERALAPGVTVPVDAPLLQLAVMNLLENARCHAAGGAPYRVVAARGARAVRIEVQDRGPGVPRAQRTRIFEAFERGDARLSRATEGTGIGLALVRAVARAHGGEATVEPRDGGGATFVIELGDGGDGR